jgi:hypothetical protein
VVHGRDSGWVGPQIVPRGRRSPGSSFPQSCACSDQRSRER